MGEVNCVRAARALYGRVHFADGRVTVSAFQSENCVRGY